MRTTLQSESSDCAFACLVMVAQYYGSTLTISDLKQKFGSTSSGTGLREMLLMAEAIGFRGRALRVEVSGLSHIVLPAILHWNQNHYVVLSRVRSRLRETKYEILDPASGKRTISHGELSNLFTGVVMEVEETDANIFKSNAPRLTLTAIVKGTRSFRSTVMLITGLSIIVQIGTLLLPLLTQVVVDRAVPTADVDLLVLLLFLGFGVLAFSALSHLVRAHILIYSALKISQHLSGSLFGHLMRLPYRFFDTRSSGDVLTRFSSVRIVSQALAEDLPTLVVDIVAAACAITLLAVYSGALALISAGGLLSYVVVRMALLSREREIELRQLNARARHDSMLLESIRAMVTLKMLGKEQERTRNWHSAQSEAIGHEGRLERLRVSFDTMSLFAVSCVAILTTMCAAWFVIKSKFTLGMLFAVASYSQIFITSSLSVARKSFAVKMLALHLERLEEIALLEPEILVSESNLTPRIDISDIELRDIYFSYSAFSPVILKGLNLRISKGNKVGIIGSSGCGKTTLLKIICGLITPSAGNVHIGGLPMDNTSRVAYRKSIATVLQEDTLLTGTIRENISFFDINLDARLVEECARSTSIHDDIMAMPMRYETLVGDMGSSLSAGQRQRILFARALYKAPDLLVLDESTAHLDAAVASRIYEHLKTIQTTMVFVTHQRESLGFVDDIYELKNGLLTRVTD